jgi:hypothetical protein
MAWIAGVVLASFALFILCGLLAPAKEHDPQRGQAVGCLTIALVVLLGLLAMLAAGVYWDVGLLVWVPFGVAVFPAVSLIGGGVYHLVRRRLPPRAEAARPLRAVSRRAGHRAGPRPGRRRHSARRGEGGGRRTGGDRISATNFRGGLSSCS